MELELNKYESKITDNGIVYPDLNELVVRRVPDLETLSERAGGLLSIIENASENEAYEIWFSDNETTSEFRNLNLDLDLKTSDLNEKVLTVGEGKENENYLTTVVWENAEYNGELRNVDFWFASYDTFDRLAGLQRKMAVERLIGENVETDMPIEELRGFFGGTSSEVGEGEADEPQKQSKKKKPHKHKRQIRRMMLARKQL